MSGARLTSATSAADGFGILAAVTMTPEQLEQAVREVQDRTDKPFGVNFRPHQPDLDDRIAGGRQRRSGDGDRFDEGAGQRGVAGLLRQQHPGQLVEPETAPVLGHRDAGQPHLG